jgi:hypothetical protein
LTRRAGRDRDYLLAQLENRLIKLRDELGLSLMALGRLLATAASTASVTGDEAASKRCARMARRSSMAGVSLSWSRVAAMGDPLDLQASFRFARRQNVGVGRH